MQHYDVVIVGGGSAASALAHRLSEDASTSVLVLEAGRWDWLADIFVHMPAALTIPIGNRLYDWKYASDPEPHMNGRRVYHARGKIMGGSSSINGMIFQRGNPMDFERWGADAGMQTWDYAHCLPYFKRMENTIAAADDDIWRGKDGPLKLERGPADSPLHDAFFQAVQEAGYPLTEDVNGYRQEGFAKFDRNVYGGNRWSASRAYLHPIAGRKNLHVKTRAFVTRLLTAGTRVTGVEMRYRGTTRRIGAGQVIVAAGAINTPQLLQLSGIGPAEYLRSLGIDVVADLPGVGANLQDHLEAYVQHSCTQPVSQQPYMSWLHKPWVGAAWLLARKGPAATNHFEAGGFIRSNEEVAYPNIMFHFLPIAVRYDGTSPVSGHGYQLHVGPMYSDARGELKIRSTDPRQAPSMVFNYLSTDQDRREWVEAMRATRAILDAPAFAELSGGEISPGPGVGSDEEVLEWVRNDAETALHPSCTAKMGPESDPMAVVDPETMGVHGMEGLSVVDASAFPYVTNGNIYAPVMMMAEKAADLIAGNTPLEAQNSAFYRHGTGMPMEQNTEPAGSR